MTRVNETRADTMRAAAGGERLSLCRPLLDQR